MAAEAPRTAVTLMIDGRGITVPKGTTVYQAARSAGVDIPIFCYHDRMPPLGACRMCLVEVQKMSKLQTACTLEASEGMVVSTTSPAVRAAQESMLELLLINHPLDCPICDKGGECPLQDQAFRYGPGRSRFIEAKRDHAKPLSLGPVLALDRERCILCWRCVRFGEIIAGDDALKGFERGFASEVGTPRALPVESKFIGNTIAICPVGALTSRTYRFRARPWDIDPVASTCTYCGVGCSVWLDVRGGEILRTRAREEPEVNDAWLCDLGFFGHGYVAAGDRLTTPLVRREGRLQEASWDEALDLVAERLRASAERGPGRVAFLGGRRLSNEDASAAAGFFRDVVGTPHLDHRVDAPPDGASLGVSWGLRSSLEDLGRGDVFVLVGCDITEEYPVLWLRIKAAIDRGASLVIVHAKRLEIRRHARRELLDRHDRLAPLVAALAADETVASGERVHVLLGRLAMDGPDGPNLLRSADSLVRRVNGTLHIARGRGNDFGAQRFGLLPGEGGMAAPGILQGAAAGAFDLLYVAGSDPATAVTDGAAWESARSGVGFLVVHEAFLSETAQAADVVLPALVLPEKDGTVTNLEGRTLALRAAVKGPGQARADREIFDLLAARMGVVRGHDTATRIEPVARIEPAAAGAGASPSLIVVVADRLFTQGSMAGRCRGLIELAGTAHCLIHPADAARAGVTDLGLVEMVTEHASVVVQARVSDVTLPGQVLVHRGYDGVPVHALARWSPAPAGVEVRPVAPPGGETP
ncbi:MAG: NADH-quinone oxidoreductase subunit NuoG [bacterium]|nr:NADH-quinone oxidoreductase subunit NuoG [bacterium]